MKTIMIIGVLAQNGITCLPNTSQMQYGLIQLALSRTQYLLQTANRNRDTHVNVSTYYKRNFHDTNKNHHSKCKPSAASGNIKCSCNVSRLLIKVE
jgi:hypothetical protein